MSEADNSQSHPESIDTPQVSLEHRLKALRLPTILREYDKVAQRCAAEDIDYPRFLLRITELELLDRERRATELRVRQAKFPALKSLDSFDFLAIPSLNKAMALELAHSEFIARRGVEGPLPLRSRGLLPRKSNNFQAISWPTFTPPQWPGYTLALTERLAPPQVPILPLPPQGAWRWRGFCRLLTGGRCRSGPSPCGNCLCLESWKLEGFHRSASRPWEPGR